MFNKQVYCLKLIKITLVNINDNKNQLQLMKVNMSIS